MCTFKICVCTDDTEPFLKHSGQPCLSVVFYTSWKEKSSNWCTINVVYNQVLMRVFCWSLTSFNVKRFWLAFVIKERNKILSCLHFWEHFFQLGDFEWIVLYIATEVQSEKIEAAVIQVEPCPFVVSPPAYLCRGTLTPAHAVCGSGVTSTRDISERFQPEPPPKSCSPPPPRGYCFGRAGERWNCLKNLSPKISLCHSDTFYKVPMRIYNFLFLLKRGNSFIR